MLSKLNSICSQTLAWMLGLAWAFPLIYAFWAAFHSGEYVTRFDLFAPIQLDNFVSAWQQAPFVRYMFNTLMIALLILLGQLVVCTLAAYALARIHFNGRAMVFSFIIMQLMVTPEILIVENYQSLALLGMIDSYGAVAVPYIASAFGIFLLRQSFKTIPIEMEHAARVEGCNLGQIIWKVYVPMAKPTYAAYTLVSISHHWNNFLWPLVVTNTEASRPLTVGLSIFGAPESGVDWPVICAGTLITIAPLLILFLIFQRQFIQSFIQSGIK